MRIEIDPKLRFVRQTRTTQKYESIDILQRSLDNVVEQLGAVPRPEYVLLQDLRDAPGRNDPQFEAVMATQRVRLSGGFRKVALLAATQVGRLQIQRYVEADSLPAKVFLDEAEAMRWLLPVA